MGRRVGAVRVWSRSVALSEAHLWRDVGVVFSRQRAHRVRVKGESRRGGVGRRVREAPAGSARVGMYCALGVVFSRRQAHRGRGVGQYLAGVGRRDGAAPGVGVVSHP